MQALSRGLDQITFRRILSWAMLMLWALWFGGTIATFVFAKHFFSSLPRPGAVEAANAMFHGFANYELVLAGLMIACCGTLLVVFPSRAYIILVGVLILAGGMAVTVALGLMPAMDSLRLDGKSQTDEFKKLHGKSMVAMTMQSGMLLMAGAMIVSTMDSRWQPAVAREEQEAEEPLAVSRT